MAKEYTITGTAGDAVRVPTEGAIYRGVTSRTATSMSVSEMRATYNNGLFYRMDNRAVQHDPVSMDGYISLYEERSEFSVPPA